MGVESINSAKIRPVEQPQKSWAVSEYVSGKINSFAIETLSNQIKVGVKWVWQVVWLRIQDDWPALILLFLSATGVFPLWISLAMAIVGIALIANTIAKSKERIGELIAITNELRQERNELEASNLKLEDQLTELRVDHDGLSKEKNDLVEERDQAIADRRRAVDEQAPILIERDRLAGENQQFRETNRHLVQERDEIAAQKKTKEEEHSRALSEISALRANAGQRDDYRELSQQLSQFKELYDQMTQDGNQESTTHYALTTLIPKYKSHRENLHEKLSKAIDRLPQDQSTLRLILGEILRTSQNETDHVEKISQSLHLITSLSRPLAQFVSQTKIVQLQVFHV